MNYDKEIIPQDNMIKIHKPPDYTAVYEHVGIKMLKENIPKHKVRFKTKIVKCIQGNSKMN